ncbi:MAG: hydrogenase nickel incorporation protein HypB [Thermoplasmata archaeon]
MHQTVDISVEHRVLDMNRKLAEEIKGVLTGKGIHAVEFTGAVGSGKTLLIEKIGKRLKEKGNGVAAIAGDVAGNDDYLRFLGAGFKAVNINTGKECHLDAHYVEHALDDLDLTGIKYLFIENVGNLVCPADFPVGAHLRLVVISVTEGDDMVRKHPLLFTQTPFLVINKVDLAEYVEVSPDVLIRDYSKINPKGKVFLTDAKHDKGVEQLVSAIESFFLKPLV